MIKISELLVRKPGMIAVFHNIPQLKKRLDWGYYSTPQASANNRKIPQTRGRVLGGSGSINVADFTVLRMVPFIGTSLYSTS